MEPGTPFNSQQNASPMQHQQKQPQQLQKQPSLQNLLPEILNLQQSDIQAVLQQLLPSPSGSSSNADPTANIQALLATLQQEEQMLLQQINSQRQNSASSSGGPTINTLNNYNCQIFTLPNQMPISVTATSNPDKTSTATLTSMLAQQLGQGQQQQGQKQQGQQQQQQQFSRGPQTPVRIKQEMKYTPPSHHGLMPTSSSISVSSSENSIHSSTAKNVTQSASTSRSSTASSGNDGSNFQSNKGANSQTYNSATFQNNNNNNNNGNLHGNNNGATCPTNTPSSSAIRVVKKEADATSATTIACCLCSKDIEGVSVSALADIYTAHLMQHLETIMDDSHCPKCPMNFEQKASMVEHFLRTHGQMKKLQCEFCPREFWLRKYLNQHLADKHEDDCITLD